MNKIICQKCSNEISNEFGVTLTYCTNCGASIKNLQAEKTIALNEVPTLVSPKPINYNAPSNSKTTRNVLGCFGIGFGLVLLSMVGIAAYWYWSVKAEYHPDYYGKITTPKSQIVRISGGETMEIDSLDPQKRGYVNAEMSSALFDGLAEYNNQNTDLMPSLATSWQKNADSTVWTVFLRKEAKWSDGKPITSNDFVYSWKRFLNPDLKLYKGTLGFIKNADKYSENLAKFEEVGIRAVDDYTLELTMEKPTPFFHKMFAFPELRPIPTHTVEKFGENWAKPENIVVSGAFKLAEWKPKDKMVLERNPQFWDNANTKLEKIVFPSPEKVPAERFDPIQLYKDGEIDVTYGKGSPEDKIYSTKKDYLTGKLFSNDFLNVNTKIKPFDDVRVRRALSLAINREGFNSQIVLRTGSYLFVPELKDYQKPKETVFNPVEARKLLAEAGFPNGTGFPEIEYIYSINSQNAELAEFVKTQWEKELRVKVKLVYMEFRDFVKKRKALEFKGVAFTGWTGDYADPHSFLALLSDEKNYSGWNDKTYNEMLEKTNSEPDETKRYQMLNATENYLLEQQPVIPLTVRSTRILCKPYIKNLNRNPLGYINWREVYVDQNATADKL